MFDVVGRVPVTTKRMQDLKEITDTDFLKVDVQGAELYVLRGAGRCLEDAVVVHTEAEFVPMYKEQPLFAEVDQFLRQSGFIFHKFDGVAGRPFKPLGAQTTSTTRSASHCGPRRLLQGLHGTRETFIAKADQTGRDIAHRLRIRGPGGPGPDGA